MEDKPIVTENTANGINNKNNPKKIELGTISKDSLDHYILHSKLRRGMKVGFGLMATSGFVNVLDSYSLHNLPPLTVIDDIRAGYGWALGVAMGYVLWWLFTPTDAHSISQGFKDPILKTEAEPLLYRGKPLQIGEHRLQSGDKILYVSLPIPKGNPELDGKTASLYGDAVKMAVSDVKNRFSGYKAVVIDDMGSLPQGITTNANRITADQLIAGKKLAPSESAPVILSAEAFDRLAFSEKDELQQALDKLGDPKLSDDFDKARTAQTDKDRDFWKEQIVKSIQLSLDRDIGSSLSGAQVIHTDEAPLFRTKIYDRVQILVSHWPQSLGKLVVHTESPADGSSTKLLHKTLGIDEDVSLDKLDDLDKQYGSQLRYIIYELVRKNPFDGLMQTPVLDKEKIARALADLGHPIDESVRGSMRLVDSTKRDPFTRTLNRYLWPVFISAMLLAASPVTNEYMPQISGTPNVPMSMGKIDSENEAGMRYSHQSLVPGRSPKHRVHWAIETQGNISPTGYYTMETSHEISRGDWLFDQADMRREGLDIPSVSGLSLADFKKDHSEPDVLVIKRPLEIPAMGSIRFKLPINTGTQLAYLRIENINDGQALHRGQYDVYRSTDGTITLQVYQNPFQRIWGIQVGAFFTPTTDFPVRASRPIPPIDERQLSPDVRAQIATARANTLTEDEFIENLRYTTADNHLYSITSANAWRFPLVTSPEGLVEIVEHDKLCDCDTCNADNVLKTTLGLQTDAFVNLAIGYMNTNPKFLLGETMHAYGLNNKGEIVDATPTKINNDPETLKYLSLLRQNFEGKDGEEFLKHISDLMGKETANWDRAKAVMIPLSVAAILIFGFMRLKEKTNREDIIKKAQHVSKQMLLSCLTKQDLTEIYHLLSWKSYGGETNLGGTAFLEGKSKKEIYEMIANDVSGDVLERYLADINSLTKAKMWLLAKGLTH